MTRRRLQILYVNQDQRLDPHQRIRSIGGLGEDGAHWRLKVAAAIAGIEEGRWSFYVCVAGDPVEVEIASHEGIKYLKARVDVFSPDSLLGLEVCPPDAVTKMLARLSAPLTSLPWLKRSQ